MSPKSKKRDSFLLLLERKDGDRFEAVLEWGGDKLVLTDFRPMGDRYAPFPVGSVIEIPVSGRDLVLDHFAVHAPPDSRGEETMDGNEFNAIAQTATARHASEATSAAAGIITCVGCIAFHCGSQDKRWLWCGELREYGCCQKKCAACPLVGGENE
jgi:hypothetical protein